MDATKIAKIYLRSLQNVYRPVREFRVVDGSGFRHVSQRFYRLIEDELTGLGFSTLGDIEDVTVNEQGKPAPRTFIRVMVDRERTTMAGFFQIAPLWFWRIAIWAFGFPSKCIELESHSTDGYWLITTTATRKSETPRPDTIIVDFVPRSLATAQLYERHRQNLAMNSRSFNRIDTLDDAIKREVEQVARKREYLVSIGWVTPEYIASQGCPASMVPEVYAASQRLLSEGYDASLDS